MQILKADAATNILLGPFVAYDDGVTPVTNVTLGGADEASLCKHSGTTFTDLTSDSRTFTHISGGMYYLSLAQGDVDTEGRLDVFVRDDDAVLPVWKSFMVVNANVFDSLYAAATTDYLQVDTLQLGGATQSATDLKDFADTGYTPGTHSVYLVDTCTTNTDMRGTDSAALAASWTSTRAGYIDELGSANIPADIDAITGYVDCLPASLNNISTTEVNAEVDTALADINLDHLCKNATSGADMTTECADNTIMSRVLANGDTSAFVPSTDSLQAIRDKETDIETDTAEIGTAGAGLSDLGGMSTTMKGQVEAECTDAIEADGLDHLVAASVTGTDITDNSIIAKMTSKESTADWDDFVNTTDSLQAIRDNQSGTAASIADAVWDEATTGHTTAGTFGEQAKTDIDAILTDTNSLNDGTISELSQGKPTATPTIKQALAAFYMGWRNKQTVTSTLHDFYNDAGTQICKQTLSDASGTTTISEMESGA